MNHHNFENTYFVIFQNESSKFLITLTNPWTTGLVVLTSLIFKSKKLNDYPIKQKKKKENEDF